MQKIEIPAQLRWSCHGCGICCTAPDAPLTNAEAAHLETLAPQLLGPDEPFAEIDPANPDRQILAKCNGGCCFLAPDGRCLIHNHFGFSSKPLPCRQFPFFFVKTPDAIQTGILFTCPSAVENRGEPLEAQRSEIEALLRGDPEQGVEPASPLPLPETLYLNENVELAWPDYLLIEQQLRAMILRPEWTIEEALISGSLWLGMLEMFLRQRQDGASVSDSIHYFSQAMEANQYERILGIARRGRGSAALQRSFLGMVISFRNSLTRRRGIANVIWTILSSYARHFTRTGRIRIVPLQAPLEYAKFKRVRMNANAPELQEILRRVIHHALERKDLLRDGSVTRGYGLLLIFYAMIRWYAMVLAAQRGSSVMERGDLVEGVSLAERYYGAHSTFFTLFEENPVLERIFNNLLRQKNFAHSMMK